MAVRELLRQVAACEIPKETFPPPISADRAGRGVVQRSGMRDPMTRREVLKDPKRAQ